MCNAAHSGGYTCIPEWNCRCIDATGGDGGGGGETCGCVAWGSGSMHNPDNAPAAWRNSSVGVGRNDVEAEWGSTGGGHVATNCSSFSSKSACVDSGRRSRGCQWSDGVGSSSGTGGAAAAAAAGSGHCENRFEVAEALTYAADRVGGYWFSTQGPGENVSWQVVGKSIGAHARTHARTHARLAACLTYQPAACSPLDAAAHFTLTTWIVHACPAHVTASQPTRHASMLR